MIQVQVSMSITLESRGKLESTSDLFQKKHKQFIKKMCLNV
jgi:hypothetical protein